MTKFPFIQTNNIHTEMRITPIFFMSLLSWKFFNIEIYNHHKVAILTMIIGFISLGVYLKILMILYTITSFCFFLFIPFIQ